MSLPDFLPYSEVIYFLFIAGVVSVAATSLGALIRAWSWKVPRTMAMAFLGVGIMFTIALRFFDRLSSQ